MNQYKLFMSDAGDWYVLAVLTEQNEVEILYEGHHREEALESMMNREGLYVPNSIEKNMTDGSYTPSRSDWD
jgi:hypothetical protein